ncbi:hypothetical protein EF513_05985 [Rickettsiales endosymbiont of Stachyamoeba lipophora]|nr:hypothetical protein EF513_05985 [Rickettsiales endosymbiont of Stachyamoeba lipophora]
MAQINAAFYNAYSSRDPRFDDVFYIGVTSTNIYCRPIYTVKTPHPETKRLYPTAERISELNVDDLTTLGIIQSRVRSIITLAQQIASGRLKLEAGIDPKITIKQLTVLPGIDDWTAHYIAMRVLRWSDAFPKEDIAVRNNFGGVTAKEAEKISQTWRPWRSYATLHLWQNQIQPKE